MTGRTALIPWLVVAILLAGGCASVTFKRGASPGAMSADESACGGRETAEPAAFRQCMKDRGWFVAGQSEDSVAGSAVETPAAEWLAQKRQQTATPVATTTAAATAASAASTGTSGAAGPAVAAPTTVPETAMAPVVAAPLPAASAFDPMAEKKVTSWWKLGGSAAAFDGAVATCVTELGVAHRPDPPATTVTAGLKACLRAAGWYGM